MNKMDTAKKVMEAMASKNTHDADKYLTDNFTFSGPVPQPVGKKEWMDIHTALFKALPDWDFNLSDLRETGNKVTCTVQITGTHKRTLSIHGLPTVQPTGKKISLPKERIEVSFSGDKIMGVKTDGVKGGGVMGIYQQLGVNVSTPEMVEMH